MNKEIKKPFKGIIPKINKKQEDFKKSIKLYKNHIKMF